MPFERPSLSALVGRAETDLAANLPGADGQLRFGVLPALLRTNAGAHHGLYGYLDWLALQLMPDTAEAEELARWASIWGIVRKPAEASAGQAAVTGTNGSVIPAATQLLRSDGASYRTTIDATIAGGTATLNVVADVAGVASNMPATAKLRFVSPIAGVSGEATIAGAGLVAGVDVESDNALRLRLLARIQQPPHGGDKYDYAVWAGEVPGVTRVWVSAAELGLGTVTVRFARDDDADPIPSGGEVAAVQAYLDERRPVTAQVFVVAPIANPVAFQIRIVPATDAVKAAVEAELRDLIKRDSVPGGTLLLSRLREAVSIAAGETDNTLVAPAANVVSGAGALATFDSITWVP